MTNFFASNSSGRQPLITTLSYLVVIGIVNSVAVRYGAAFSLKKRIAA